MSVTRRGDKQIASAVTRKCKRKTSTAGTDLGSSEAIDQTRENLLPRVATEGYKITLLRRELILDSTLRRSRAALPSLRVLSLIVLTSISAAR